jgi:hypothetical protein
MSKFYSLFSKLIFVFIASIVFSACSNTLLGNNETNNTSKPVTRTVPVADIIYVDLNPLNVQRSLSDLSNTIYNRYQATEVPAGAVEGFPVMGLAAVENNPYVVVQLYDSADSGLPTIGVVIGTTDLYIAGYINNMRDGATNQTFYRYTNARVTQVTGVNRTQDMGFTDSYGDTESQQIVDYFNIRRQIQVIATLNGGQNNGIITQTTTRVLSPLLAESIRFSPVLGEMIRIMQRVQNQTTGQPPQFRFADFFARYFGNWDSDTTHLRDYLASPLRDDPLIRNLIAIVRQRVHIFLRATPAQLEGAIRATLTDIITTLPPTPPPASIFRYVIGSFESGNGKWISEVRQEIKQTRDALANDVPDPSVEWPLAYCIHYQGSEGNPFFQNAIGRNSGNLNLFFEGRDSFSVTDSAIQDQRWHAITNLTGNHNLISQTEYRLDENGSKDTNINGTVVSSTSSCQP